MSDSNHDFDVSDGVELRASEKENVLETFGLSKTYTEAGCSLEILKQINLQIRAQDFIAIVGSSGSGKSTLLHMLGGLELPTGGSVKIKGKDYSELSVEQRATWRGRHLGFIYQLHHLLPEFSALENVAMPLRLQNASQQEAEEKAAVWLDEVGLSARLKHRPSELSGGERQRVAIARALVCQPACVLADEPTGNLDSDTAIKVQDLMFRLNEERGVSFVVVTHDLKFAQRIQQVYQMQDGELSLV